jgi:hypothetical protein
MKNRVEPKKQRADEPMGIVISGGPVRDAAPLIAAYVWGPAPEKTRNTPRRKQPDRVSAAAV